MAPDNSLDALKIQAHNELESFVRIFAAKYRPLFSNGAFNYRIYSSDVPEDTFHYKVEIKIQIK